MSLLVSLPWASPHAQPAPPAPEEAAPEEAAPTPPIAPAPATSAPAPPALHDVATRLRLANVAAQVGDWAQVAALVAPLTPSALALTDRAELHRLRGLAAFFLRGAQGLDTAEAELLAYARLDLDAQLDPATVPPEAVTYFESVQAKHRAELRALRVLRAQRARPARRSFWLTLVPVAGQLQNGHRGKAWALATAYVAFTAASLTSYLVVRRWCRDADGTCDRDGVDHTESARTLVTVNAVSGAALLATYAVGVYDAISGYRRAPQISPLVGEGKVGVAVVGRF